MFDENYNRFRMKILSILYDCNLSESERERILAKMDEKKVKNDDLSKIYKEDFYEFCKRMLYMLNASGFSIPQCRRIITKINEEKAISDNPKTDKEKREREASERILSTPPNNDKSKDTQDKHGRPIQDEKEKRIDNNAGGENGMSFADELRERREPENKREIEVAKNIVERFKQYCREKSVSGNYCEFYFILGRCNLRASQGEDDWGEVSINRVSNSDFGITIFGEYGNNISVSGDHVYFNLPDHICYDDDFKGLTNVHTDTTGFVISEIKKQLPSLGLLNCSLSEKKMHATFSYKERTYHTKSFIDKMFDWENRIKKDMSEYGNSSSAEIDVYVISARW